MWPNSPAKPFMPRCTLPFVTSPPPMPVPRVTRIMLSVPRAAPSCHSAMVAQVASLSTSTVRPRRSDSSRPDLEIGHAVEVGRSPQDAGTGDETRHTDPQRVPVGRRDRSRLRFRLGFGLGFVGELGREFDQGVDQLAQTAVATWRGTIGRGHDRPVAVEGDALRLGAADVDADPPASRHDVLTPRRGPSAHERC